MARFFQRDLYGGAITADLPEGLIDVSDIRQVPDNQEVFLFQNNLTSIIFDILEYVTPETAGGNTDEDALRYHFNDIVNTASARENPADHDETKFWGSEELKLAKMPNVKALSLMATQHSQTQSQDPTQQQDMWAAAAAAQNKPSKPQPDFTGILMLLIRLEKQTTDIVTTVNVPHVPGEYEKEGVELEKGRMGRLMEDAVEVKKKIVETFEVRDWGLFGEG